MSPRHLAEIRALHARIDATGDNHIREHLLDPRVSHYEGTTTCCCGFTSWKRHHLTPIAPRWCIQRLQATPDHVDRLAVIDDFGYLVEVHP